MTSWGMTNGLCKSRKLDEAIVQSSLEMAASFSITTITVKHMYGSYMFDLERILITRMQLMCVCRCEHYSMRLGGTRDHLLSYEVGNGLYDTDYLKALFNDDED